MAQRIPPNKSLQRTAPFEPPLSSNVRQKSVKGPFRENGRGKKALVSAHGSRLLPAALAGDATKLRESLDSDDDVNAYDEHGMTALLNAIFIGDPEAVRLLLEVGADPNRAQRSDPTATPLWHARDDLGLHEISDLLVQAGANDGRSV